MWLPKWVKARPVLAGFITFVVTVVVVIPTAIAGMWRFWSNEPFAVVAQRNNLGRFVVGPYYGWFTLVFVVACGGLLCMLIGVSLTHRSGGIDISEPAKPAWRLFPSLDSRDGGKLVTFLVSITNNGPTATFFAQIEWVGGLGLVAGPVVPALAKWQGSSADRLEILKGQTRHIEVAVFEHEADEDGRLRLPTIRLVPPQGGIEKFTPMAKVLGVATNEVKVDFTVHSSNGEQLRRTASTVVVVSGKKSYYYEHLLDD